jgi:hypothetical protein
MMNRVFDPEATIDVGADGAEAARPGQHRLPAQPPQEVRVQYHDPGV